MTNTSITKLIISWGNNDIGKCRRVHDMAEIKQDRKVSENIENPSNEPKIDGRGIAQDYLIAEQPTLQDDASLPIEYDEDGLPRLNNEGSPFSPKYVGKHGDTSNLHNNTIAELHKRFNEDNTNHIAEQAIVNNRGSGGDIKRFDVEVTKTNENDIIITIPDENKSYKLDVEIGSVPPDDKEGFVVKEIEVLDRESGETIKYSEQNSATQEKIDESVSEALRGVTTQI